MNNTLINLYKATYDNATELANKITRIEDHYTHIGFTNYNDSTTYYSNSMIDDCIQWANVELQYTATYIALLSNYNKANKAEASAEADELLKAIKHNSKISLVSYDVYMQKRIRYVLAKNIINLASYYQYLASYFANNEVAAKYKSIEYSVYNPTITYNELLQIYLLLDYSYRDNLVIKNELRGMIC